MTTDQIVVLGVGGTLILAVFVAMVWAVFDAFRDLRLANQINRRFEQRDTEKWTKKSGTP